MALIYDIRKDLRYQQGREEGREKEHREAQKQLAVRLKQEKTALAKGMKQEGIATEVIARITGLSKSQVEKS